MTTLEKLKPFLIEAGAEEERISPEARLREDLGLDSLDLVLIGSAIETHSNINLQELDPATLKSIQDLVTAVEIRSPMSVFWYNTPKTDKHNDQDHLINVIKALSFENRESVVDFLFAIQTGRVSCRAGASQLIALHKTEKK